MEKVIETERLILRKPILSDAEELVSLLNDEKVAEFVPTLFIQTYHEAIAYLSIIDMYDYDNEFSYVIVEKSSNKIVGILDAYWTSDNDVPISYACKSSQRGNGFIVEAVKAFIIFISNNFCYDAITFSIRNDNKASKKVMQKLGIHSYYKTGGFSHYSVSLKEELPF